MLLRELTVAAREREAGEKHVGLGGVRAVAGSEERGTRLGQLVQAGPLCPEERLAEAEHEQRALRILCRPERERLAEEPGCAREGVDRERMLARVAQRHARPLLERGRVLPGE